MSKRLTREEEADEIVKRLKTPPKSPQDNLLDDIMEQLSEEIRIQIDNEILEKLIGISKA